MLEYIYIGILILFSIISKFQNNSKFGEIKECSLQRIIKDYAIALINPDIDRYLF